MLKRIAIALAVLIAGFLIFVALQPSEYAVSRKIVIKAKPEAIFAYVNSPKKCNEWMPWADLDKEMKSTYFGPEEGVGAGNSWESPGQMGVGKATVVESAPNQLVKTQLEYTKPMEMSQMAEVSLAASADGTVVKWSVTGHNSFMGRLFCIFMNMDKMVGGYFETGLNKLKTIAEGAGA